MKSRFEIRDRFYLDGEPFQIISGSIHYFRVVRPYWRDRLEKLRAMGCNTVETYVPWNLHEPRKNSFRFDGMLDLAAFLKTADDLGLKAIVRPSPYICAEWEFGGLPAWLLAEDGIRLRCSYPPFLDAVKNYYRRLFEVLAPLQVDRGGPVLLMQVENEYGSYGDETEYLRELRDEMRKDGVTVPLITSDGPVTDFLRCGGLPDELATANFGSKAKQQLDVLKAHTNDGPLMCTEFWVGWFDAWGDKKHHTAPAEENASDLEEILSRGSVNIYMFHGGTNFGFMNGANNSGRLAPGITSYDYDAPLSEDGGITPKYLALRGVIGRHRKVPDMDFTAKIEKFGYGEQAVSGRASLFSEVEKFPSVENPWPLCMEKIGQNYGYTLYRSSLDPDDGLSSLQLVRAADRVQIFLDGSPFETLYDRETGKECGVPSRYSGCTRLDILVENMGRVNYGQLLEEQRKGIDGAVLVNGRRHSGWTMTALSMDSSSLELLDFSGGYTPGLPSFSRVLFYAEKTADTFLDMTGWGKGCVLVNGFNLGRFWDKGPQRRMYLPAPLLRKGVNELIVFETEGKAAETVVLKDSSDLG